MQNGWNMAQSGQIVGKDVWTNPAQTAPKKKRISAFGRQMERVCRSVAPKYKLTVSATTLEWMSTLIISAIIMYLGNVLTCVISRQCGPTEWTGEAVSRTEIVLRTGFLLLVPLFATTLARSRVGWLTVPVGVLAGLTVWKLAGSALAMGAVYKEAAAGRFADVAAFVRQICPHLGLLLMLGIELAVMLHTMYLLIYAKGVKTQITLCGAWFGLYLLCTLVGASGSFRDNLDKVAPCVFVMLEALSWALPALFGKAERRAVAEAAPAVTEEAAPAAMPTTSKEKKQLAPAAAVDKPADAVKKAAEYAPQKEAAPQQISGVTESARQESYYPEISPAMAELMRRAALYEKKKRPTPAVNKPADVVKKAAECAPQKEAAPQQISGVTESARQEGYYPEISEAMAELIRKAAIYEQEKRQREAARR